VGPGNYVLDGGSPDLLVGGNFDWGKGRPIEKEPIGTICGHRAKTAEPIEMPLGLWVWMGPGNYVLDGGSHPP